MEGESIRISDVKLLQLPKVSNPAGNISAINGGIDIPFEIKRVYYLYDIPGGEDRGAHAHKDLSQLVIAVSGSFSVVLDDGNGKLEINLKRPYEGLLLPPGLWRELKDFSSGAICLVLASKIYEENDYLRSYEDFVKWKWK